MASVQLLQPLLALLGLIKTRIGQFAARSLFCQERDSALQARLEWMQASCLADSLFYYKFK